MTYNNQNSEKYWNNKILEWENSYLNNNEARVSFVEKIASKFRGPLKKQLEVSERIISENSSKENIYLEFGSGSGELLFSLQFFYLKYQGCPKFNKFERSSFSKINNCHFLDIGSLTFVTNIQI